MDDGPVDIAWNGPAKGIVGCIVNLDDGDLVA